MRQVRLSAALSCVLALAAAIAVFVGTSSAGVSAPAPVVQRAQLDVEFAFDTTTSMRPSIEAAKRDAESIVARVREAFPDSQFAVVSFRDYGNPSGDYEVLQPMTGDLDAVRVAFGRLRTAGKPSPSNTLAEEYNLVFRRSYTDPAIGWRPQTRKVVVVVGDAEPHSAGRAGIPGCKDTSVDHYGLDSAEVLAGMRAAQRTLLMIRQVRPDTSAALPCYEALAERAYEGGAARDGGRGDLGEPIVALIKDAVAPVYLRPDVGVALPGRTAGYTATVSNPNGFSLGLQSLTITLPPGFRVRSRSGPRVSSASARTLVWQMRRALQPSEKLSVHFRTSAPRRRGRYRARAVLQVQLPGGQQIASNGHASVRVAPRLRSLVVSARGQRPLGPTGKAALRGAVRISFGRRSRSLAAGRLLAGRLMLTQGPGRSLTLRVRSHRIVAFGSPTVLRLRGRVEHVRGISRCVRHARGSVTMVDDQRLRRGRLTSDAVVTAFGAACRAASSRWSNRGSMQSTVATTAR